jgi:hypothetical protein
MTDTTFTDEDLQEGTLYVFKNGVLQEIEIDQDDQTKKIKITREAHVKAAELQSKLRKALGGYRPDLTTICSALIFEFSNHENVISVVKNFTLNLYRSIENDGVQK